MCPALVHGPVEIRGVVYPGPKAAAQALGLHPETVRTAIRKGTLHRCGTGRVGPEPMPVRIAGRTFADARAAAAHHGVAPATVWAAVCDADPDRIARAPRWKPWRARPFTIGGITFPSMLEAERALGLTAGYIRTSIKRGSKRGYERIVAAAMAYAARAAQPDQKGKTR